MIEWEVVFVSILAAIEAVKCVKNRELPMSNYIFKARVELTVLDNEVIANGYIIPAHAYNKSEITVNLQIQNEESKWITLVSWSDKGAGICEAGGAEKKIGNYKYRTYIVGKVFDNCGNTLETVMKYSNII